MKQITLEEWDRRIAPFLSTIEIRARQVQTDAKQILEWVKMLPVAPGFETKALDELVNARTDAAIAADILQEAINRFMEKEKVK